MMRPSATPDRGRGRGMGPLPSRARPARAPAIRIAALILAAGVLHSSVAAARRDNHVDAQWTHPEVSRATVRTIAILPATTFDGNHRAAAAVAAVWAGAVPDTGYSWISADEVLKRLDAAKRLGDVDVAGGEIRKSGAIGAATAQRLCRALDAQGVLCLRVDKWEEMLAADSRRSASVEIRCALVDSGGTELWRVSGRSTYEGQRVTGPSLEIVSTTQPHQGPATTPAGRQAVGQQSSGSGGSGGSGSGGSGGGGGSSGSGGGAATGGASATFQDPGRGSAPSQLRVRDEAPSGEPSGFEAALRSLFADWVPLLPPSPAKPKS